MTDLAPLFRRIADYAATYRAGANGRPHKPGVSAEAAQARFNAPAPERGAAIEDVIEELIALTEPGLAAMTGPRFFGWVIGGSAPAGVAADWLASVWGQNTGNALASPSSSACEEIAARWLLDLLHLPEESSVGFVTGATMANFTCLAAARGDVLRRVGWDVEADGMFDAPPIHVVLGEEAHSTVFSALKYLGLGYRRVVSVPVTCEGVMRADAFAQAIAGLEGPIIAITQAGHINSGAFDPIGEIADIAHAKGAWVHVDGAFGLWGRAASDIAPRLQGVEKADSWGVDGHKWLQTPYDSGYAIVRHADAHRRAMLIAASYLPAQEGSRHPADYVPELSRRARGFATWAMIKALGREGIAEMVSRMSAQARRMAQRLAQEPGVEIMNEVVLNQVAVRFGADLDAAKADDLTNRTIARIQREGECFVGGANWRGRQIVRISVCGASTTDADIDRSADAMLSAWRAERGADL
ncbi:pyridoxal phosphate-dependent decarboxylase family protein [Terricaulis sp.]|uniref:pyridoxal phosphate-dependent decarboxylase family protein n=1 Tax=Terricaulis sp. TaxID=2768686 RepID=UPI003783577C